MMRTVLVAIALLSCKGARTKPGAALAKKYLDARNITANDFTKLTAEVEKALGPVKVKSEDVWEWAEVDGDQCWHFIVDRSRVAGEAFYAEARTAGPFEKCKSIAEAK